MLIETMVHRCAFSRNHECREIFSMDGFYTTYNESASGVTAPRTIFEQQQRDTRAMVAAVEEGDGASCL